MAIAAANAHAEIAVTHTRVAAVDSAAVTYLLEIDNLGSGDLSSVAIHVAPVGNSLVAGDTGVVVSYLPAGGHATAEWTAQYSQSVDESVDQLPKELLFIGTDINGGEVVFSAVSNEGVAQ